MRSTILVKAGLGLMGANWVILPILGERVFHIHVAGFGAQASGMLGMSLLMACRGLGAIVGPLWSGHWAGGSRQRMRAGHSLRLSVARAWATSDSASPPICRWRARPWPSLMRADPRSGCSPPPCCSCRRRTATAGGSFRRIRPQRADDVALQLHGRVLGGPRRIAGRDRPRSGCDPLCAGAAVVARVAALRGHRLTR